MEALGRVETGTTSATAAGEAIIGQIFLAVTVARVVALQITHGSDDDGTD